MCYWEEKEQLSSSWNLSFKLVWNDFQREDGAMNGNSEHSKPKMLQDWCGCSQWSGDGGEQLRPCFEMKSSLLPSLSKVIKAWRQSDSTFSSSTTQLQRAIQMFSVVSCIQWGGRNLKKLPTVKFFIQIEYAYKV